MTTISKKLLQPLIDGKVVTPDYIIPLFPSRMLDERSPDVHDWHVELASNVFAYLRVLLRVSDGATQFSTEASCLIGDHALVFVDRGWSYE